MKNFESYTAKKTISKRNIQLILRQDLAFFGHRELLTILREAIQFSTVVKLRLNPLLI